MYFQVLNVSRNCVNHFPEYFEYLNVPVEDRVYADISQHFNKALQFIGTSTFTSTFTFTLSVSVFTCSFSDRIIFT